MDGDVDFEVAGEPEPDRPDDELPTNGPIPRRIWLIGGVVLALLVAGVAITHLGRHGHPPQAGPAHPAAVSPRAPSSVATVGRPAAGGRREQAPATVATPLDVAATPTGAWVLMRTALQAVDGTRVIRSVPVSGLDEPDSFPQLAVDDQARRLWIVLEGGRDSRMIEFDARTLRRLRDVRWDQPVQSAAAYLGHLYVSTDRGVADLAPGAAAPNFIGGLYGAVGPIAVDPTRHRLVMLDLGYPTDIWTYRPNHAPVEASQPLALGQPTVAVADGAIWVGGFAVSGAAVLERLDPVTLRPVAQSPLAEELGPGAVIVAAGSRVIWLRSGNGGDALVCADSARGRIEQNWDVDGAVASTSRGALIATDSGVIAPLLVGCRG